MSAIKDGSPKNKKTATQTLARDVVAQMHVNFDDYAEKLSEAVLKGDAMYIEQLQGELEEYERNCVKERLSADIKQQYRVVMENAKAMKEQN
jgi:ribosomal 50S subunit-recycling heat shock protein